MDVETFVKQYNYLLEDGWAVRYAGSGQPPEPSAIESVEAISHWEGSYAEEEVQALLRLKDGRYATLTAYCDTSGYDCIGSVDWRIFDTFDEAVLFGLDKGARTNLFPEDDND